MHPLTRDVIYATGLRREIAKPAIACVLLFLRSEGPGHIAEWVDRLREQVTAALRNGGGAAAEQLAKLEGQSCADINILAGRLAHLGLHPTQIVCMMNAIIAHAETLVSETRAAEVHGILTELSKAFERMSEPGALQRASV